MSKTIIISESMAEELQESLSMTKFKFLANMKKFLANLLTDPVNSEPEFIFTHNGLNKSDLINHLLDNNIILRKNTIDDHDADGNPHTAKMVVKYTVPKNRLNDKLDCLYDILFPSIINEDGCAGAMGGGIGGAASANISAGGQYSQPIFGVQRRSPKKNKTDESKIYEAVTGEDVEKSAATYVYCNDKKGKLHILCAKRIKFPDDEMGGKWNPPMGHLHKGESMIDGAIRECFEESGVKLEKKYLKLISKEDYGNVYKVMLPGTIEDYPPKKGDEENGKFKWLPIEEIGNLEWAWTCGKIAKKLAKNETLNEDREERMSLLLCESAVNNNRKKAKHYVFNFLQTNTDIADGLKQVLNQQNISQQQDENGNIYYQTNGGTFLPFNEYIFQNIITELNLGRFGGGANTTIDNAKYDLGLVRMYIQNGWVNHRQDTVEKLSKIVQLLKNSPHFFKNIQGFNLQDFSNNWTLDQTYDVCKDEFKKLSQNYKQQYSELGTSNLRTDYKIIPIRNTKEASKYSKYTSWCVCGSQQAYDSYAGEFGIFYFCLQNGFKKVPEQPGDNCPLDEYGLSMIAVCVTAEGMIKNVTCRWNHDHGAGDQVMSVEELAKYFNTDPSQIFPPRSMDELVQMGYYPYEMVEEDVSKGDYSRLNLVERFNNGGVYCVNGNKYVIVVNNQVLNNQWFDWVGDFDDYGIAPVQLNGKITWFSLEKQDYLFPNQWFDWVGSFKNGIAQVPLNDKMTWFSLEKQDYLFQDKWFDYVDNFYDGIARVQLNDKYTWFSLEKQDYLFPNKWFDWVDNFYDGIARVELNDKYYYFTLDGQLLDDNTRQPLSQEQVQKLFQQQQIAEMVNRLVKNYLR